eukprot:3752797-Pyramimonas_sp.AAC.1
MQWKADQYTVDGRLRLIEPSKLAWTKPLSYAKIPIACLLDELSAKGFRGVVRLLFRAKRGKKEFDSRK